MTTYSLTGITVNFSDDGSGDAVASSIDSGTFLNMYVPEGGATTLSYTTGTGIDGETITAIFDEPDDALLGIGYDSYPDPSEEFVIELTWDDNGTTRTTVVFGVDELIDTGNGEDYANRMHVFYLSGDALPDISSLSDWQAFEDSIQSEGVATGAFAPNQDIALSTFFQTSSENDTVNGTSGDDLIETGAGDDEIYADIGGGDDTVNSGDGDDWMSVGEQNATLNGGDGYDTAALYDWQGNDILVEFGAGSDGDDIQITGYENDTLDNPGDALFTIQATEVERVSIGRSQGEVLVEGDDGDNRFRIDEIEGDLTYNGGDGTDRLELHRFRYEDDEGVAQRGLSLDTFLELVNLNGSATSLVFQDTDDNEPFAVLNNVEEVRFTDQTVTTAELLELAGTTITEIRGTSEGEELEGTEGSDDIFGNGGNDTIIGNGGDDWMVVEEQSATLDGGEGFDDAVVLDTSGNDILVDFGAGDTGDQLHILGFSDGDLAVNNAPQYRVETTNVERAVLVATGAVEVDGNGSNNRVRLNEIPETFTFNGGGGTDQLDLHRLWYEDDTDTRVRGMTLEAFLDGTTLEGSASSLTIYDSDDNSLIGYLNDVELIRFEDQTLTVTEVLEQAGGGGGGTTTSGGNDTIGGTTGDDTLEGGGGDDRLEGGEGADTLDGGTGSDRLDGGEGDDALDGGDGADTLIGGEGNDTLTGGDSDADVRDVIYAGDGNDSLDGGYGNDELRGDAGNDTIEGGFGVDTVIGGVGDDVLTGSAWSDELFGGDGEDFVNGGFGSDRVNGGDGADRFFHIGLAGHGSDWIQDYDASEGDVLVFGDTSATADQFLVQFAETENAGQAGVEEAFVTYIPNGQIMWALVDGGEQDEIVLRIAGVDYDLLA